MSRRVLVGRVPIGGGAPVSVQSMLCVHHSDVEGNVRQAVELERAGCDIIRVAVPCAEAVALIPAIKAAVSVPLVADIHFDYRLAIASVDAGVDKIRLNPGNIGDDDRVKQVVRRCRAAGVPIRVGVNSGSVEKEILAKYGGPTPEALVESAMAHVSLIERCDYDNIVISLKSTDLKTMMRSYRLAHEKTDYPLHLGVTEAGTYLAGVVKSSVGIGALLCEGIGDTIRVSLTDDPTKEVAAARAILKAVNAEGSGVKVVSCPTCGRTEIDLIPIAKEVERRTAHIKKDITVAVMGCVVNGPGEASNADIGIAGGRDSAVLFRRGVVERVIRGDIASALVEEIEKMQDGEQ